MLKLLALLSLISSLAFGGALAAKEPAVTKAAGNSDTLVCTLGNFSTNGFYTDGSDSAAKIYQESNGNQYVKLSYNTQTSYANKKSSFYAVSSQTIAPLSGTYTLEFDVRFDENFDTTSLYYSVFESGRTSRSEGATMAASRVALEESVTPIVGSTWKHAVFPVILVGAHYRSYDAIKIGFDTLGKATNYIDIDNIELRKGEDLTFNETINVNEYIREGYKSLGDFEDVPEGFPSPTDTFSVEYDGVSNHYGKLRAINGVSSVDIYAKGYMSANRRTFEFKAKKGPAFDGTLQLFASDTSTNPTFDLSAVSTDEWTVVSGRYNVKDTESDYLSLRLTSTNEDPDNYLLIDEMYAIYGEDRNLINVGADFTVVGDHLPESNDWLYDYRLHTLSPDNHVVYREDGGKALKLYRETHIAPNFTLKLNPNIYADPGWYKLVFKIKGGPDFYTNNIGYRLFCTTESFTNKAITSDVTIIGESDHYKYIDKWDSASGTFYLNNDEPAQYLGLNMWFFLHNDKEQYRSPDNYCLIDDIQIFKQNPMTGEVGPNLIDQDVSTIAGFDAMQGVQYDGVLGLDGYEHSKPIIAKNSLEQFEENYVFTSFSPEQNYWGSTELDIPAKIVKEDGYHAALLTFDEMNITKNFSSMAHLLTVDELEATKRYVLEFDYKTEISTVDPSRVIRVAFVGSANLDEYMINLLDRGPGTYQTVGVNRHMYDYVITSNGDGWNHVRMVFEPDHGFKVRVNSIRFLLDSKLETGNKFYLSNIALIEHSATPYGFTPAVQGNVGWIVAGSVVGALAIGGAVTVPIVLKKRKRIL